MRYSWSWTGASRHESHRPCRTGHTPQVRSPLTPPRRPPSRLDSGGGGHGFPLIKWGLSPVRGDDRGTTSGTGTWCRCGRRGCGGRARPGRCMYGIKTRRQRTTWLSRRSHRRYRSTKQRSTALSQRETSFPRASGLVPRKDDAHGVGVSGTYVSPAEDDGFGPLRRPDRRVVEYLETRPGVNLVSSGLLRRRHRPCCGCVTVVPNPLSTVSVRIWSCRSWGWVCAWRFSLLRRGSGPFVSGRRGAVRVEETTVLCRGHVRSGGRVWVFVDRDLVW